MKWGNIYVANIGFNVTGQAITNLFSDYGEVVSVKIITDKFQDSLLKDVALLRWDQRMKQRTRLQNLIGNLL